MDDNEEPKTDPFPESKELEVKRDEAGRFIGGVPNPKGRPKGSISVTGLIKKMLKEKPSYKTALGARIMEMALSGNEQMIKLIWNYFDGMPIQRQEIARLDLDAIIGKLEKTENYDDVATEIVEQSVADDTSVQNQGQIGKSGSIQTEQNSTDAPSTKEESPLQPDSQG